MHWNAHEPWQDVEERRIESISAVYCDRLKITAESDILVPDAVSGYKGAFPVKSVAGPRLGVENRSTNFHAA